MSYTIEELEGMVFDAVGGAATINSKGATYSDRAAARLFASGLSLAHQLISTMKELQQARDNALDEAAEKCIELTPHEQTEMIGMTFAHEIRKLKSNRAD